VNLRIRLTLWHGLVLGLVLIGFTVAVYALLAQSLSQQMDRALADRAHEVNSALVPLSPFSTRVVIPRAETFASADTFVQVSYLDGEIVGASDNLGEAVLAITPDDVVAVRGGAGRYREGELQDERVRVHAAPLSVQGRTVGVIQVARSLRSIDQALDQLRLFAGAGLLIAMGLSGLVVWLTAAAALQPLERVIETAEAIGSSGDLGRRVPPAVSDDEVGRMASTFNRMLDRLEASTSALWEAYGKVGTALDAQRRFVADASHELRTPLTTIRNNIGLLRSFSQVTPEDREAALVQMGQEAERMSRLVQDLLALARADTGQAEPRTTVALAPLVKDVVAQARVVSAGNHRITADVRQAGEVVGDPDALRQVTLLLLDNAMKYAPAKGRIQVRLESRDGEVALSVADNGVGIDPEDMPHIFERFYRADRSRRAGGTGLGLAIAKGIVEQHGGDIDVESKPGKGAIFTVRLPKAGGLERVLSGA